MSSISSSCCSRCMHHRLELLLGLGVDVIVLFRREAIFFRLPILRHHDDRRRIRRLEAEREVEQDERIGIPVLDVRRDVQDHPDHQDDRTG